MNKFLRSILATALLSLPVLAQHVNTTDINYGNGVVVKETSGTGAPTDVCTGLLRYNQTDATSGQNIWQCESGHMAQQGSATTSSPATPSAFGTVKLATGQSSTTLSKVATTGVYSDLTGLPTIASYADFIASGSSHAHGLVPDPGATAGSTRYLREDGTWNVPSGSGNLADPGGNGLIVRTAANTTRPATYADVQAALSTDTTHNTYITGSAATSGDVLPTQVAGHGYFTYKAGLFQIAYGINSYSPIALQTDLPATASLTTKGDMAGYSTTPVRVPVGTDGQVPTADSTQAAGWKWAPPSGSNPYIIPRDNVWHSVKMSAQSNAFQAQGMYWALNTGSTASGAAAFISDVSGNDSVHMSTTAVVGANAVTSGSTHYAVLSKNPTARIAAGLSTVSGTNAWVFGLGSFISPNDISGDGDISTSRNVAVIGMRYYAGTDTNWTCYLSDGSHAGQTADSGVAPVALTGTPLTTSLPVFDFFWNNTSKTATYAVNGVQVCSIVLTSGHTMTSGAYGTGFTFQNTTTTAVTGYIGDIYGGENF